HGVRRPVLSAAAVDHASDIGMLQARQDLPLALEAAQDPLGVHAALDYLDGYFFAEDIIIAARQVDHAHTATAELGENLIGARVRDGGFLASAEREHRLSDRAGHRAGRLGVGGEQDLYFASQLAVVPTLLSEPCGARGGLDVERLVEQFLNTLPAFRGHVASSKPCRDRLRGPAPWAGKPR